METSEQWQALINWLAKHDHDTVSFANLLTSIAGTRCLVSAVESWINKKRQPRPHWFKAIYKATRGIVDANSYYDLKLGV